MSGYSWCCWQSTATHLKWEGALIESQTVVKKDTKLLVWITVIFCLGQGLDKSCTIQQAWRGAPSTVEWLADADIRLFSLHFVFIVSLFHTPFGVMHFAGEVQTSFNGSGFQMR